MLQKYVQNLLQSYVFRQSLQHLTTKFSIAINLVMFLPEIFGIFPSSNIALLCNFRFSKRLSAVQKATYFHKNNVIFPISYLLL